MRFWIAWFDKIDAEGGYNYENAKNIEIEYVEFAVPSYPPHFAYKVMDDYTRLAPRLKSYVFDEVGGKAHERMGWFGIRLWKKRTPS